jgi:uncharacterized protein
VPRAATSCRLDLANPGTGHPRAFVAGRSPGPGRSALVHLPPRSIRLATPGGLCDRSRHRFVSGAKSSAPPCAGGPLGQPANSRHTAPAGLVLDRRSPRHRRTVVRSADSRRHQPGVGGRAAAHAARGRLVRLVTWYQRAVEGRPSPCRFTPSCSSYALEALQRYGTLRGVVLTLRRLSRCRPFGPSGWDPVPSPDRRVEPRKRMAAS